ncbi:MAG: hypothetical protein GY799_19625 [Desulfobulbaceae bacterium]|nr:hypothetical protein [Desulfobulbaceae bacterium]
MSLQDAITALAPLGGKNQGDLIKHGEWNTLISSVTTIAEELQELQVKVNEIETFVGFEQNVDYTLREKIETLEGFVGEAADTIDIDTLAGRVRKLEETDVVEQEEFNTFMTNDYNDFKDSIEPLRDQYVVTLETTEANYNLGERAVLTATVRTLDNEIPPGRPWVDFITSWGKLKSFNGFTTRSGIDGHSISVRTNSEGIAKVRISSEHVQEQSEADELQIEGFFENIVPANNGRTVRQTLNDASNASGETAIAAYGEMKKVYQRSNMAPIQKFTDTYYAGSLNASWQGGISFGGNWKYYRSTVVAIAKEDGDPTTPNSKSAASAIQLTFKDWVGPWIDWYLEDDLFEVGQITGLLGPKVDPRINVTMQAFKTTMGDEVQSAHGLVHQNKFLNAFIKALDQIDIPMDPELSEQLKETVNYGIGSQKSWNLLNYSGASGGGKVTQPGFDAVMNHAIQLSAVDTLDTDVKDLKGSVSTLQESSSTIGGQVLGAMSDMNNKIIEFNVPQRQVLIDNIELINSRVNEILGKV